MRGHAHDSTAGTQNQGNTLGDRSCVRQSKLYRIRESGNDMKSLLGASNLAWKTDVKEGAYMGQRVYDHDNPEGIDYRGHHSSVQNRRSDPRWDDYDDRDYRGKKTEGKFSMQKQAGAGAGGPGRTRNDSYEDMRRGYDDDVVSKPHARSYALSQAPTVSEAQISRVQKYIPGLVVRPAENNDRQRDRGGRDSRDADRYDRYERDNYHDENKNDCRGSYRRGSVGDRGDSRDDYPAQGSAQQVPVGRYRDQYRSTRPW
jgi:hypothetical protein